MSHLHDKPFQKRALEDKLIPKGMFSMKLCKKVCVLLKLSDATRDPAIKIEVEECFYI